MLGTVAIFGAMLFVNYAIDNALAFDCEDKTVTIHPGDTAWGLASTYCDGHTGAATDAIVASYGSASLTIGDTIVLP